jgi:2-haloacid dehalogenase
MPSIFVFDAYGTLFDVHSAIAKYRNAVGPDADRMSELWRTKQLEYTWTLTLAGRYIDFWALTERALDFALLRSPSIDKALKGNLMDAYLTLDAYPDARVMLHDIKISGKRTAILSNGTPAMLDAAIGAAMLRSELDFILSVDPLRMYKPRPEVYQLVVDACGAAPAEVVFISSNRWDVMGASTFGFRTVWVNRAGLPQEYPEFAPHQMLTDLRGVASLI